MRHYEIMLLIHPDQSERARVMMDRYVGIIEGGQGQVHRNEDLGRRMLAYPIAKVQKAHYMLMNVECGKDTLDELVGALHFSDAVLRHLVVRRDDAVTEQSALARAVEREAARENREFPYDRELSHGRKASGGQRGGAARAAPAGDEAGDAPAAKEGADAGDAPPAKDAATAVDAVAEPDAAQEQAAEESQPAAQQASSEADADADADAGEAQAEEPPAAGQEAEAPSDAGQPEAAEGGEQDAGEKNQ